MLKLIEAVGKKLKALPVGEHICPYECIGADIRRNAQRQTVHGFFSQSERFFLRGNIFKYAVGIKSRNYGDISASGTLRIVKGYAEITFYRIAPCKACG